MPFRIWVLPPRRARTTAHGWPQTSSRIIGLAGTMSLVMENGNILHSVNLPNVSMPRDPAFTRVCIIHRNVPNTISLLAGKLADAGINIENMQSKSRKDYAYTILDVTGDFSSDSAKKMEESEDIIRVRVI